MAELSRDDLTDKYDDLFDDNAVMKRGPEVLRAFRDDIRDSFALLTEVGKGSTGNALGEFVTTFYSPTEWRVRLPASFPRNQATIDHLLSFATAAKASPPASYGETLSSSKTQVEGIVASFPSTQSFEVTPIAGVSGSPVTLQLLDSSDGNSTTTVDALSGYADAGTFYKFHKKNGSTHEALLPAAATSITV